MNIPLNKEEYSVESKRSIGHEYLGDEYKDIKYKCTKCKKKTVFSAIEQKKTYEVRKEYMWTRRELCNLCWREMRSLKSELYNIENKYCENKAESLLSRAFLSNWLESLELYPKYGKTGNPARIAFVKKHLMGIELES